METGPRHDAVIAHGYHNSERNPESMAFKNSLRAHASVLAASEIYKRGQAGKVVVAAGRVWGPNSEPQSSVMRDQLVRYGVPEQDIVVADGGMTTKKEIDIFNELARANNWTDLADVSFDKHKQNIEPLYGDQNKSIHHYTVEGVLSQHKDRRIRQFIDKLSHSSLEFNYGIFQGVIGLTRLFDPEYMLLGKVADKMRGGKNHYGLPIISSILPVDQYTIFGKKVGFAHKKPVTPYSVERQQKLEQAS